MFSDAENNLVLNATLGSGAQTKTDWFGFLVIPMEGTDSNLPRFEFFTRGGQSICKFKRANEFREGKWNQMSGGDFCQILVPEGGHLKLATPVALPDY